MKANPNLITEFLAATNTTFVIPVYQRNNDWSRIQCKQLLDDILQIGENEKIKSHFIGSIVYVHDSVYTVLGLKELTVIDGEEDKLKLKATENNKKAIVHILSTNDINEFKGYSRIVENFKYFQTQINAENFEIIQKGLSKLMFVDIGLDRQNDNPQRIFESLNSTGLALSQADLIRNYILMDLTPKVQSKIYNNYWQFIEDLAKDEENNQNKLSDFVRDFLTLENRNIPNKDKVYLEFKKKYSEEKTEQELEEILIKIKSLVNFYNKLLNPKNEPDKEIRIQLEYIKKLEINVAYPFLMKVYASYFPY